MTFVRASTGSVNHTVTSISSPAPKGPLAAGLVVVMFVTSGVSVDTTMSRFIPSEQPLKVTHVPGSGRLALAAVAPCNVVYYFYCSKRDETKQDYETSSVRARLRANRQMHARNEGPSLGGRQQSVRYM